ncbi:DUF7002 family protein [Chloroflexota bacterium]
MKIEELIKNYSVLYHMAEFGSWESIQQHGLLSTTALLNLFEYTGEKRYKIESEWRPSSILIEHPVYGKAIIRDQKMPPEETKPLLKDITLKEWYEFLNRKAFFWVNRYRLSRLLNAYSYRNRSHTVIFINTKRLVGMYADKVTLSDINTGFSSWGGLRGRDTFKSIDKFLSNRTVWELAVDYAVEQISDLTIKVEEWKGDKIMNTIWKP